jgi:hypothetical protein
MFTKVMLLGAIAASALAVTSTALAGGGSSQNAREAAACVQAGIGTLVSLGLIDEAARGQIDYDALDSDSAPFTSGAINANLPPGSFIPLKDVVSLHRTNPELFDWCA